MGKMSEAEKMEIMYAWLDEVCETLDVKSDLLEIVTPAMLDLIRDVAHGPSRPGAPMTAMLIGLAAGLAQGEEAGRDDDDADLSPTSPQALGGAIKNNILAIEELIEAYVND
ncbi:MAG: DUF6457 domain-containing protein [Bowdeniella nasicola]|nr:DUF6457 domain-containing protein [Bowdeniella nasicola]